jgi:hypothetical protein
MCANHSRDTKAGGEVMTKVKIPSEMLKAATCNLDMARPIDAQQFYDRKAAIESAVRWLVDELGKSEGISPMLNGTYQMGWNAAWRHIRRMFLTPEPESPCDIDDAKLDAFIKTWTDEWNEKATTADQFLRDLTEFRRGQQAARQQEITINTDLGGGLYIDTQAEGACRVCGGMNGFHQPMCKERRR